MFVCPKASVVVMRKYHLFQHRILANGFPSGRFMGLDLTN